MSNLFGKEKFYLALLDLVAPGDIHARVASALSQHLLHIREDEDLPESAREAFKRFRHSLGLPQDGHVREIIRDMPETDVEKIAQHIVTLYEQVITA